MATVSLTENYWLALIVCMFPLIGGACHPKEDGPASPTELQNSASKPFHYRFDGVGTEGKPCSTGHQEFERAHEFCMALQNENRNNHCGLEERFKKFQDVCHPLRYRYGESRACVLTIAKPNALGVGLGIAPMFDLNESPFRNEDVLSEVPHCIGRYSNDLGIFAGGTQEFYVGQLLPELTVSVQSNFVEEVTRERLGERAGKNQIRIELWDNQTRSRLLEEFDSGETAFMKTGLTANGQYKFAFRCVRVHACDSAALHAILEREDARRGGK